MRHSLFKSCGTDPFARCSFGLIKQQETRKQKIVAVGRCGCKGYTRKGGMMRTMNKRKGREQRHAQRGKTYDAQKIWREVRDKRFVRMTQKRARRSFRCSSASTT